MTPCQGERGGVVALSRLRQDGRCGGSSGADCTADDKGKAVIRRLSYFQRLKI